MIDRFGPIRSTRKWLPAGAILLGLAVLPALVRSQGAGGVEPGGPLKVVVQVNFAKTTDQRQGLKNIGNILKTAAAEGIPAEVEIVCHGEGIRLVEKARTELAAEVVATANQGVRFVACENTMRERSLGKDDLLPNVGTVPSGAFEIVIRQRDGYSFFRP
jgi:intracellular sulfur oxidation DsrE/DsrF family protein